MSSTELKKTDLKNHPHSRRRATVREMVLIFAACLVLFWVGNARTGLWDRDEARYAQASAMMLHDGDWIVPKYFEYQPQPE
ncbi:MAG: hypothetical protein KAI25_05430, partial [Hyphomicrobiaceae bacterium]|nr:hypothetical protein [Hyphomicrobiaceae bacterium]